jgi:methylenetetrahydrofolate dehydrogenase (NADP+) / methenyltetrahydrofolate cyclohydrolase
MASARIIDGKQIAQTLLCAIAADVDRLKRERGLTPGLAVVLVGENDASRVYVRNKAAQTRAAGMVSFENTLPSTITEIELLALIDELNRNADVHGILVQLPLPRQINSRRVIEAIDPNKDVDGFHPLNIGRLSVGEHALAPCTPAGCLILAKSAQPKLSGLTAVVIGRSNIVGKPVAQLLLREDCTVTIAHSRTRNLPDVVREADLLIAAVGQPELVRGDWIKPGAVVIDVGINRAIGRDGKSRLVGDVAYDEAVNVAGAITPVPGGVGPMTIACLLRNTVEVAKAAVTGT